MLGRSQPAVFLKFGSSAELLLLFVIFLRKGVKECKSCLREITDPAELPCSHIFCTRCILEWTNKQCKICKEEFPEDYTPTASEATRYPGAGKNLPVSSVFVLNVGTEDAGA